MDPEALRIRGSVPAALPPVARHQELSARYIERIEGDPKHPELKRVELRIDELP